MAPWRHLLGVIHVEKSTKSFHPINPRCRQKRQNRWLNRFSIQSSATTSADETFHTTNLIFVDNQLVVGNWIIESKACWLCRAVLVYKHPGFYSICTFCLIKKYQKIKKIRTASPRATRPPRIFILPAQERCLLFIKAGFVTGKDLNLFNRCFKLGVGDQLVY